MSSNLILLVAVVAIAAAIWVRYNNKARAERIVIHSVGFEEYDKNFIRLSYEIENKGKKDEKAALLSKIYDAKGEELASIFFLADIEAHTREYQSKYIDKLNRPLREGEKPYKATLELRQRDLMNY
jgi:hypothetical protein